MNAILATIFSGLAKGLLETFIKNIPWAIIIERTISRVVVVGLRSLAKMTSNTLDDEIVEEVIGQIKRPELPEVK